jgi:hypothetical protein
LTAVQGLFHLTALTKLDLTCYNLSGWARSLIKPGDCPHSEELNMSGNDLSYDPVGAIKGLLRDNKIRNRYISILLIDWK